jgi:hypothetical protein
MKGLLPILLVSVVAGCVAANDPEHDHAAVAGTVASDAVRDPATAISVARKECTDKRPSDRPWLARLEGDNWHAWQAAPKNQDTYTGLDASVTKKDGKLVNCSICVVVTTHDEGLYP